jgi:hypothetical protein
VSVMLTRTRKSGLPVWVAGALLFALAALVAVTSVTSLLGYSESEPTFLGIAIPSKEILANAGTCQYDH